MDFLKLIKEAGNIKRKLKEVEEHLSRQKESITHKGISLEINGKGEILNLAIDESLCQNKGALERTVLEAVNRGTQKARDMQKKALQKITGGSDFPDLPFMH